jgi:hypothetical protein
MLKQWLVLGIVLSPVISVSTPGPVSTVEPASAAPAVGTSAATTATSDADWRVGTVRQVDGPRGLVLLSDGTALQTTSATHVLVGRRPGFIGELRPGDVVVFRELSVPAPPASPPTASGTMTMPPTDSALPREAYAEGPVSVSDLKVVPAKPPR